LSEEQRRPREDPPDWGPSVPPDLMINPLAGGIAIFTAVAIPIVVVGLTRTGGANGMIIAIGIVVGLLAGVLAGIWLARRGGRVWRGPRI